jgi:predicted ester cyclase
MERDRALLQAKVSVMSNVVENASVTVRWLEGFWGRSWTAKVVDDLAAADIAFQFSTQTRLRGREEAKKLLTEIHDAFPDLEFYCAAVVADGDKVVCGLECVGTHTGAAFFDELIGAFPAHSGHQMHAAGTTVLRIRDGKVLEDTTRMTAVVSLHRFRKTAAHLRKHEAGQSH